MPGDSATAAADRADCEAEADCPPIELSIEMMARTHDCPIVNRNVCPAQGAQIPLTATILPSEAAWAINPFAGSRSRTSTTPYHDCRSPRWRNPVTSTVAGIPEAASLTAARISSRRAAQYISYFDATPLTFPGMVVGGTLHNGVHLPARLGVDAAQVVGELGGELVAGLGNGTGRLDRARIAPRPSVRATSGLDSRTIHSRILRRNSSAIRSRQSWYSAHARTCGAHPHSPSGRMPLTSGVAAMLARFGTNGVPCHALRWPFVIAARLSAMSWAAARPPAPGSGLSWVSRPVRSRSPMSTLTVFARVTDGGRRW
jgi:hypothetical protein